MATANVEEVLKKIHIVFAKGKTIGGNPDSVVLSKSEMFALLNELNEAMYAVLDKYEASQRSKEKARLEVERRASEIVTQAKQDADDVHAASILYTDNMLAEITTAIADATEAMKNEYMLFLQRMDDQIQTIQENRDEINAQLAELHEGEFYLNALNEFRREEAEDYEDDEYEEDSEEDDNASPAENPDMQNANATQNPGYDTSYAGASQNNSDVAQNMNQNPVGSANASSGTAATAPRSHSSVSRPVRPSKKKKKKHGGQKPQPAPVEEEWPEEEKPAPPVIRVNKPGENPGIEVTTKWNRNKKKKNSSNANSLFDEEIDDIDNDILAKVPRDANGQLLASALKNMTPEQIEALEKSVPAYGQGFTADDFDLDAEYEQFKREKGEIEEEKPVEKKGFLGFFSKKGKQK